MNLFARGVGGHISDLANAKWAMPGRLWTQTILLAFEGAFVLIFANSRSLVGAIVTMVFFSIFVQAAEAATFGKVQFYIKTSLYVDMWTNMLSSFRYCPLC